MLSLHQWIRINIIVKVKEEIWIEKYVCYNKNNLVNETTSKTSPNLCDCRVPQNIHTYLAARENASTVHLSDLWLNYENEFKLIGDFFHQFHC